MLKNKLTFLTLIITLVISQIVLATDILAQDYSVTGDDYLTATGQVTKLAIKNSPVAKYSFEVCVYDASLAKEVCAIEYRMGDFLDRYIRAIETAITSNRSIILGYFGKPNPPPVHTHKFADVTIVSG